MPSLRTRLALAPVAAALWLCAALWRIGAFLDVEDRDSDSEAAWGLLCVLVISVALYALWRSWVVLDGSEWLYGWRR